MCAVAATAWIAATTTTQNLRGEPGQSLSDGNEIYDALIGYAATHRGWDGVQRFVTELADETGRTITLTTPSRTRLAASPGAARVLPDRPAAVIDPLNLNVVLARTDSGPIDPRAVGPYRLTAKERATVRTETAKALACVREVGLEPKVVELPSGRRQILFPDVYHQAKIANVCDLYTYQAPSPARRAALDELTAQTAECLDVEPKTVEVTQDFAVRLQDETRTTMADAVAQQCLDGARQQQLRPYVAPAALLFVGTSGQAAAQEPAEFELSGDGVTRIALAAALVLAVTVGVSVVVGRRLVRPLRTLISAAQQPAERTPRIAVGADDEIGRLAVAFNDLAERRERLEEQRTTMVGDVAHELRSPLTNIRSWLEAAQDGITPADRRLLDLLLDEAVLLQHIIDDLRDLAAADAGSLALHTEPVHLPDVLDHVASAHSGTAAQAGVTLSTHVEGIAVPADDHEMWYADPLRLRQIVGNLVGNAVRHTPSGGSVALSARQRKNDVLLEVVDTGTGIAPEDLPYVFDRFWRADKSRSRQTGGSGLGLSIARKLTEAHGGAITVRSTPGEGTTFTVSLPRHGG
ncbi:HAMP domain-containing protein [Streptomyces paludis]|uniref:histidine kinase n=2 Tax=Streptomyces paludis TaxID=2282738 RepID=A0A345I0Q6_9ACTN|nr:HAMP domain-containing sensor histidine kinase [Streptomyces paludis]AXG82530.1 HAMP domain-containing protein [Streptomyces paludis]